jgi:[Skp1-protein]-hydroxyproline N-acetylglucosaminyltransferase
MWTVVFMIVIAILLVTIVFARPGEPFQDDPTEDQKTVFVSLASYRDALCPETLKSLYENAKNPGRVFVGICQQNDASQDADCKRTADPNVPMSQVRILRLDYLEAKGPTHARYLCSTLFEGEDYFLQIDAHCKFAKNWDAKLIRMITDLKAAGVEKPLLSHYTPDIGSHGNPPKQITTICKAFFNPKGMISFEGAGHRDPKPLPELNAFIAGGMFFAESKFLSEVPFDPNLPFLFVGEEILQSARFWTHGWDIYTPNENVVFHFYTRKDSPHFWDVKRKVTDKDATIKVRKILGLPQKGTIPLQLDLHIHKYGLGTKRPLKDFYKHAGINVSKKSVTKSFCV